MSTERDAEGYAMRLRQREAIKQDNRKRFSIHVFADQKYSRIRYYKRSDTKVVYADFQDAAYNSRGQQTLPQGAVYYHSFQVEQYRDDQNSVRTETRATYVADREELLA